MKALFVFFALLAGLALCSETYAGNEDFQKGLRYYGKRDYKRAEKYFKNYIATNPDPQAYYLLGYADYKLKKFDDASRYFAEAYLIDPDISAKVSHPTRKGRSRKK